MKRYTYALAALEARQQWLTARTRLEAAACNRALAESAEQARALVLQAASIAAMATPATTGSIDPERHMRCLRVLAQIESEAREHARALSDQAARAATVQQDLLRGVRQLRMFERHRDVCLTRHRHDALVQAAQDSDLAWLQTSAWRRSGAVDGRRARDTPAQLEVGEGSA
jgi:hypothetical protein